MQEYLREAREWVAQAPHWKFPCESWPSDRVDLVEVAKASQEAEAMFKRRD